MKRLIIGVFLLGSIASYAGVIENRKTGEEVRLSFDSKAQTVEIQSTSSQLENKTIHLKNIKNSIKSEMSLKAISGKFCNRMARNLDVTDDQEDYVSAVATCLIVPPIFLVGIPALAADLVLLPIKAPIKLFTNLKHKNDLKILLDGVFNKKETQKVSEKRFQRIINLL